MPSKKTRLDKDKLDRVVAEARRNRQQREQDYREQALKKQQGQVFILDSFKSQDNGADLNSSHSKDCVLLIRALMFRQDYRIKKIFLPFQKKGKKHHPSSRESFHLLRQKNSNAREKHPLLITWPFFPLKRNCVFSASSGSREKNQVNPVYSVRKHFSFMYN